MTVAVRHRRAWPQHARTRRTRHIVRGARRAGGAHVGRRADARCAPANEISADARRMRWTIALISHGARHGIARRVGLPVRGAGRTVRTTVNGLAGARACSIRWKRSRNAARMPFAVACIGTPQIVLTYRLYQIRARIAVNVTRIRGRESTRRAGPRGRATWRGDAVPRERPYHPA